MPQEDAALDVRLEVADGGARLQLTGPFTGRTAGRVRAALELVSVTRTRVVVDLVGVTELDGAARGLLASARSAARVEGWELAEVGADLEPAAPRQPPCGGGASRTRVTNRTSKPARS